VRREAVAVARWRTRLAVTRTRCLHVAQQSLTAAEHYRSIKRAVPAEGRTDLLPTSK
jgi:hypothetical protein